MVVVIDTNVWISALHFGAKLGPPRQAIDKAAGEDVIARVCRDPKDDMFLECAALAGAHLLISGDKDLLILGSYGTTRIIPPADYVSNRF